MTKMIFLFCAFFSAWLTVTNGAQRSVTPNDADKYLQQFGYLENVPKSRSADAEQQRKSAITAFQRYAGLPPTGKLDDATRSQMLAPRCGVKDTAIKTRGFGKWEKPKLTWALIRPTPQLRDGDVRRVLNQAFTIWTKYVPLDIVEVSPQSNADIKVEFGSRDHGDAYPFDGPNIVLAHAFYPTNGGLHFDNDEKWTTEPKTDSSYVNLFQTAIHEMGHSLGVAHLNASGAIMFPYYSPVIPLDLAPEDIQAIQQIYGPRTPGKPTQAPVGPTQPTRPPQPGSCVDVITYCNDYIKQCNTEPWMKEACPKTCRFCR
jgi:hypothetical protein